MSCFFFLGIPSGSAYALLEGTLPLRYCATRFASKVLVRVCPAVAVVLPSAVQGVGVRWVSGPGGGGKGSD